MKVTVVGLEPESLVRLDCVVPEVLQFVGFQLRPQSDTSSLLLFVDKNPGAFASDHGKCHAQLLAAVAAEGTEGIAGETLRMDSQKGRPGFDVAHEQSQSALPP